MSNKHPLLVSLVVLIGLIFVVADFTNPAVTDYTVNVNDVKGPWNHYWERCVGSGHAALALRNDYQEQMRALHRDCGFQQVRFHGLFVDDMSVVLPAYNGMYISPFII